MYIRESQCSAIKLTLYIIMYGYESDQFVQM